MKSGAVPGSGSWGEEPKSAWGKINTEHNGSRMEGKYPTLPGNYLAFYDNLYGAIRHNESLKVPPEEAMDVIRVIEAAYLSSREHRVVTLP